MVQVETCYATRSALRDLDPDLSRDDALLALHPVLFGFLPFKPLVHLFDYIIQLPLRVDV